MKLTKNDYSRLAYFKFLLSLQLYEGNLDMCSWR